MDSHAFLEQVLKRELGAGCRVTDVEMEGGGCINTAVRVVCDRNSFFVKWNSASVADMFAQEAKGLNLLKSTDTIRVPDVLGFGVEGENSWLLLEYIEQGMSDKSYWTDMGESLAALHLAKQHSFGLDHNNYIGTLRQQNGVESDWKDFFINQRLRPQLKLAQNQLPLAFIKEYQTFLGRLPQILPPTSPVLLHGDLWNGNVLPLKGGKACFFDPAIYCGGREMDLAMTRLFGGFDKAFYEAYDSVYPIPSEFDSLIDVYNLYPLMVHVNLFGINSGYTASVQRVIKRYL